LITTSGWGGRDRTSEMVESKSAEFTSKINEPSEFSSFIHPLTALRNFLRSECCRSRVACHRTSASSKSGSKRRADDLRSQSLQPQPTRHPGLPAKNSRLKKHKSTSAPAAPKETLVDNTCHWWSTWILPITSTSAAFAGRKPPQADDRWHAPQTSGLTSWET
jgi:hypothetical protein